MTNVMYRTRSCSTDIEEVVVDRVTKSSVFIDGRRTALVADWQRFHATRDEAVSFLVGRAQTNVNRRASDLTRAEKELFDVKRKYNIGE